MCMIYKGVTYGYAFTFKIPVENGSDREFNIAISNFRGVSKDFSGLCLENELRVISEERMLFAAFFDIVDRITRITIESEKNLTKDYPEFAPTPLLSAIGSDFHEQFNLHKKSQKSLEYYERLRIWFESPDSSPERQSIFPEQKHFKPKQPDIYICNSIVDFNWMAQEKGLKLKEAGFFTL